MKTHKENVKRSILYIIKQDWKKNHAQCMTEDIKNNVKALCENYTRELWNLDEEVKFFSAYLHA